MILITGGANQGKLSFAKAAYRLSAPDIKDGKSCEFGSAFSGKALCGLHLLVARLLEEGLDPFPFVEQGVRENPGIVVTCDELGCGIVPVSKKDRALREANGRVCCMLAKRADEVYRVVAGIPVRLKGASK